MGICNCPSDRSASLRPYTIFVSATTNNDSFSLSEIFELMNEI